MNEMKCYFVGLIPQGSTEMKLAEPVRPNNLAVSFTESLSEFFYDFAEKHFHCEQGDEIVLFSAHVDCSDICEIDIISSFKEKTAASVTGAPRDVIKRRVALAKDSEELSVRVRNNLYQSHRLLMESSPRC